MLPRSCVARALPQTNQANLAKWDATHKDDIQEKKIRVTWLAPSSDGHLDVAADRKSVV